MIKVSGAIVLRIGFEVDLDMTEQAFDELTAEEHQELIASNIDWQQALSQSEIDEVDIQELEETK